MDLEFLNFKFQFSGLNLRKIAHVVYQAQNMIPAFIDKASISSNCIVVTLGDVAQNVRKTENRSQGGPQFMAQMGEKLRFSPAGCLGCLFCDFRLNGFLAPGSIAAYQPV